MGDAAGSIDGGDCLERVAKGAVFADKKRLAAAVRQQLQPLARHRVALQVRRSDGREVLEDGVWGSFVVVYIPGLCEEGGGWVGGLQG